MRTLVLNEVTQEKMRLLVENAENNPFSMDELLDMYNGRVPPAGDRDGFFCELDFGYKVVLSIENQVIGKLRHLSVSVDKEDAAPNAFAFQEIMRLAGFKNHMMNCKVYIETVSETKSAINVIELIN